MSFEFETINVVSKLTANLFFKNNRFFDQNNKFYQKIDAKKMFLRDGFWSLESVTINNPVSINKKLDSYLIKTDLEADFVIQKIVNNFQNVKLFSIFELPNLIIDLQSAGFSSTKFKVYFHSLLSKPLLFLSMVLIACFFGLNDSRNNNAVLMIFLGITTGLILYITSTIVLIIRTNRVRTNTRTLALTV